jgi:hypothetical protein
MAHESFENDEIAALMNDLFVNVKVDREERPDVDQIYMAALNAMGEHGGWPMTMFLDPDGRPFWGGTYFPPEKRYGRPGFPEIMRAISKAWHTERDKLLQNGAALQNHLHALSGAASDAGLPGPQDTRAFAANLLTLYDRENGGIRGAPKFPNAPLLEVWLRAADGKAASTFGQAFLHTMERISEGGTIILAAGCRDTAWMTAGSFRISKRCSTTTPISFAAWSGRGSLNPGPCSGGESKRL